MPQAAKNTVPVPYHVLKSKQQALSLSATGTVRPSVVETVPYQIVYSSAAGTLPQSAQAEQSQYRSQLLALCTVPLLDTDTVLQSVP